MCRGKTIAGNNTTLRGNRGIVVSGAIQQVLTVMKDEAIRTETKPGK
jgi:hypothetical protein